MMRHSQPQPQPQTTFKFDLCSVAKLKQVRVRLELGWVRLGLGMGYVFIILKTPSNAGHNISCMIIIRQVFVLVFSLELTLVFYNRTNVTLITYIHWMLLFAHYY